MSDESPRSPVGDALEGSAAGAAEPGSTGAAPASWWVRLGRAASDQARGRPGAVAVRTLPRPAAGGVGWPVPVPVPRSAPPHRIPLPPGGSLPDAPAGRELLEPAAEPVPDPEPALEPASEPALEPAAEPALEPASEPALEPAAEPALEPAAEPALEPASEPALEPASEPGEQRTDGAHQPGRPRADPERLGGSRRRQIGDFLVENGVITPEQLSLAMGMQRRAPGPRRWIGRVVVDLGMAGERDVADGVARMLQLDVIDLSKVVPAPDLVRLLPRAVAERIHVLVVDRTPRGELVVAASDPTNVLALDDVRLYTRSTELKVYVATDSQIREQLNRAWSLGSDGAHVAEIVEEVSGTAADDEERWVSSGAEDEAPIVRFVTRILADGVRQRASDIHIEVQRETLRVRYRIDGVLRDVMEAPKRVSTAVISRVKIISGLDIAERRVPQDGRTRFTVEGLAIDARVSTLPSLHGEKVVIRLLTRGDDVPDLATLGLDPDQLAVLEAALAVPQGLVLITGPTGSGKTNTLYSAIARISTPELNVVTLEDPVEVQLPGITQVAVNERTGMTFSKGLRSILRQDPDIILVGEVRDGETAQLALKAAMTGHLVLTTLHTNSAVAAVTRLVDLGAEPFMVASSLTLSVAQRLVRRPCPACAAPYQPDDAILRLLGLDRRGLQGSAGRRGTGCTDCGGTGYRGRTAVYEVLDVDGPLREVLMREPRESAVAAHARAVGMVTLRHSAVRKAILGTTTFEEAVRVTASR
ncbi:MAG TPA: ATPase, T2SS/T4P/T4SS family [Kineosporiaceae bacterium]